MSTLSKKKIAITGTIGSGKSQVSKHLIELGYPVLDLDKVNASLLEKGNRGYEQLCAAKLVQLDAQGQIDKKELAHRLFSDPSVKQQVESILHSLLYQECLEWMDCQPSSLVFVEVPLLFEGNFQDAFDRIWCVVTSEKIALDRLMNYRGFTKEDALARMASQMSAKEKMERSHVVLYNEDSLENLNVQIDMALEKEKK